MIKRAIEEKIKKQLHGKRKIIVLYGPRQVGKTTLVNSVISNFQGKVLKINADEQLYNDVLSSRDFSKLKGLSEGYDLLFIDEAQRIPDIGINLKILFDNLPELKIIVTGSSSLDLANRVNEPLTGRIITNNLFPVSILEWQNFSGMNDFETAQQLEELILFGTYPEVFSWSNFNQKRKYLNDLCNSYLYKDILALASIKYPEKLNQLLRLLAYQTGQLVSLQELASTLQIHRDALINYIDLLEKSFVIFRLSGFSRNLRKEVVKMDKIYFYDTGVRNTLINDFNSLQIRNDRGQLWENFLLTERMKVNAYSDAFANSYFWRTYSGAELDLVEEKDGRLTGFEFKWGNKKAKAPVSWLENYENSGFYCINNENFVQWLKENQNFFSKI
ncbi:MAG: ATP-binding protein [Mariniphaga sp.]|jgi:predicted AAA+ superfamily ATPase|nr:ATP-binding protein [Mariniphaga sp.]